MPYKKAICSAEAGGCGREWSPRSPEDSIRGVCRSCSHFLLQQAARTKPYALRYCEVCHSQFTSKDEEKRCPSCRKLAQSHHPVSPLEEHNLAPPLKQAVFDLETFGGLDRGWGVLIAGCILIHGQGAPQWLEFDLTQSKCWPDKRSDDSELAAKIISELSECDVLYAHNGRNFDVPYLNTIALKFNLPRIRAKLVDPVQIARRNYRIGNNSLAAVTHFLGLPETKMSVAPDVWRYAVLDNDPVAWQTIRERCRSDVSILNAVAGRVTRDAGMIDQDGSAWRR